MEKELIKYFENGITIDRLRNGKYSIFTVQSQRFVVDSLDELTPERFEQAIQSQLDMKPAEDQVSIPQNDNVKIEGGTTDKLTFEYFKSIVDLPKPNQIIGINSNLINVGSKYRMIMSNNMEYDVYVHAVHLNSKRIPYRNEVAFIVEKTGRLEILSMAQIKKTVKEFKLIE